MKLPEFQLLQGKERFLVDSLLAGATGFVVSIPPQEFIPLSFHIDG